MRRIVCVVTLLIVVASPAVALQAAGLRHCAGYPVVTHTQVVQQVLPVVTNFVELLVPAAAVSFQYLPPPQMAPTPSPPTSGVQAAASYQSSASSFAAEPFESVGVSDSGSAALFQNRCFSCHGAEARGGVSLWDRAGRWQPTRNGQPISHGQIYKAVVIDKKMPKGGQLTQEEISLLNQWIAH